jgi:hypothetical protein
MLQNKIKAQFLFNLLVTLIRKSSCFPQKTKVLPSGIILTQLKYKKIHRNEVQNA